MPEIDEKLTITDLLEAGRFLLYWVSIVTAVLALTDGDDLRGVILALIVAVVTKR